MVLPKPGLFAVCESTTYPVTGAGGDWVMLHVPRDAALPPAHREAGERQDGDQWARVPRTALDRYFKVVVTVEWKGEEFGLGRVVGGTAEIHGSSPEVAARLGLEGDQYNGFRATIPVDELSVVDVRERAIHG